MTCREKNGFNEHFIALFFRKASFLCIASKFLVYYFN